MGVAVVVVGVHLPLLWYTRRDAFAVWWPATMALRRQVLSLLSVSMLLCLLPRSLICCTIADLTSSLPLKASARHRIE